MTCPHCGANSTLSTRPQTKEQFRNDMDFYLCRNGHEFEAKIPLTVDRKTGYCVRTDIK